MKIQKTFRSCKNKQCRLLSEEGVQLKKTFTLSIIDIFVDSWHHEEKICGWLT